MNRRTSRDVTKSVQGSHGDTGGRAWDCRNAFKNGQEEQKSRPFTAKMGTEGTTRIRNVEVRVNASINRSDGRR